jgi:nitronate monooxygenase
VLKTRFTDLVGCSAPLQQAPMGGASPRLAAATAAAGGLGMLSAIGSPAPALAEILDGLRAQTSGPFGVNVIVPVLDTPFIDRACIEVAAARARVVEFFYDEPDASLVETVRAGGALAGWQVGSRREAVAAAEAGCDFVVAQGVEAGGHMRGRIGLLPLLEEVLGAVDVPVVAAGGIGTGRAMVAVLVAGAAAVRVGTRFVAAEEAEYHPAYVEALIAAEPEERC